MVSVLYDSYSKTLERLIPHEKKFALLYNCLVLAFIGAENFDLFTFCGTLCESWVVGTAGAHNAL